MTATNFSNGVITSSVITWGGGGAAPTLAKYAYSAPSDPLDNTANAEQTPLSFRHGLLRVSFPSMQSASTSPPTRLGLFLLPLLDGDTLPTPPGTQPMPPAAAAKRIETMISNDQYPVPGYMVVDFGDPGDGFKLGPFKYAFQLYNGGGYLWTVAPTVTLYRWNTINS